MGLATMRLTRFTDYALRVLMYLGVRDGERATIRDISDAYGISRNHLMKVVSQLVHLGYVDARRGPGGGLTLARPAADINLAAVVRDMEEDMNLVECLGDESQCVIEPACRLRTALSAALSAFVGELEGYRLSDLIEPRQPLGALLGLDIRVT